MAARRLLVCRDRRRGNWSDVPAIIPEIGFMTNPAEDGRQATQSYQDAVVSGPAKAILEFLRGG
jgi:N-acetylmuramoyl-L-alanine amidase